MIMGYIREMEIASLVSYISELFQTVDRSFQLEFSDLFACYFEFIEILNSEMSYFCINVILKFIYILVEIGYLKKWKCLFMRVNLCISRKAEKTTYTPMTTSIKTE